MWTKRGRPRLQPRRALAAAVCSRRGARWLHGCVDLQLQLRHRGTPGGSNRRSATHGVALALGVAVGLLEIKQYVGRFVQDVIQFYTTGDDLAAGATVLPLWGPRPPCNGPRRRHDQTCRLPIALM